ncbi:MAG TPA: helix-turn-helix transcriptional regulator [Trueperaceae bacterium]|nr:helix-turn-helix transcriptional regulator [Trueperaceae bacterium]
MTSRLSPVEARNRLMLRARDEMDRRYREELDVKGLAALVGMSPAHFIRTFKEVYGETPHRYLQRRRVERAMYLLREQERSVTDACFDVGFNSLGTFSRTFKEIVGASPAAYRRGKGPAPVPSCFVAAWTRPSTFGEAPGGARPYSDPQAAGDDASPEAAEATR